MSTSVFRRETCRLCGGRDLELTLALEPTPPGDHYVTAERLDEVQETYPLDLVWCRNCGLLQLADVVAPEILYRNYIYETSISLGLVEHFERYADDVVRRVQPSQGSLVVDIGSNDGTLLKVFKERNMRVLGVDPARDVAQKATASGVETLPTFFTVDLARRIRKERGPATVITANNVFANIDDLSDLVEGIRTLLSNDGTFVVETGYMVDMIQKTILDNVYHEHLSYFSVSPLKTFFCRSDMELFDMGYTPSKGGSLRGFVQLAGGPRRVSPTVAQMMANETSLGFDTTEPLRAFKERVTSVKCELTDLLRDIKAQGGTIAGYGASVGVTTLIYHFGLGDLVSFLVDDNPSRHNLFSPGHHIPVLSPQVIYERKPEYVLLLAWRYAKPIMKKHQEYLDEGGRFIVPLPKVEVM